jgi:hypothetical protein
VLGLNVEVVNKYKQYHRVGVVAGGFVNRSFDDRNSIQMEFLYTTKGSFQPPDSLGNGEYRIRLTYFEIPVLYKYKTHLIENKQSLDKLEVEFGPSFGILLSTWQESLYIPMPVTDPFHSYDILINLGLNYYFSENFSVDVRFGNSVVPIRQHPGEVIGVFSGGDFNSAFNYTLRYSFR